MRTALIPLLLCASLSTTAQDATAFLEKGRILAADGKLEKALEAFSQAIALNPHLYDAWTNRGVVHMRMGNYELAVTDMDSVLAKDPELEHAWLSRGTALRYIDDTRGALANYNTALRLEPDYAKGYYNRGLAYEMLGEKDSACADFQRANQLGISDITEKLDICADTTRNFKPVHYIRRLRTQAADPEYGFSAQKPIKVGNGPDGMPANERAFLHLLRDGQGEPVRFTRLGSCCHFPSENGFMGMGLLDRYEVMYRDQKGKKCKAVLYINMYDYETPMVPVGFGTAP
jgi:tetratricopeptide (TPR) repeat protein